MNGNGILTAAAKADYWGASVALYDEQRTKIMKLLETAQALANDLQEPDVSYLIERAVDQCRASFIAPRGQAPYSAG